MKKTLTEELQRIHEITYGKQVVNEGFIDNLLNKIGMGGNKDGKKIDDPSKADLVTPDVADFYKTIEDASKSGGLSQQSSGNYEYQKNVESMQIGLILLGYVLPKHGVDGLFGPETGAAVTKFKKDNSILNEDASSLRDDLDSLGYKEKGSELTSGGPVKDVLTDLVSDILKSYKQTNPDVTVTLTSGNDKFHKTLSYVSKHTEGSAIDLTISPYNGKNASDFIKVLNATKGKDGKFTYIDEYTNPSKSATGGHFHLQYGGASSTSGGGSSMTKASPEMLDKLLMMLKSKGVTSEQLKSYIDSTTTGGGAEFTDLDLTTEEGVNAYSQICQKFIDSKGANPLGITGRMMADGAKQAFERYKKYVPAELALSQLVLEGGIGNKDTNSKPIRTKNPFNVGNVDSGAVVQYGQVQTAINTYYNLIAKSYLSKGKTAKDLIGNFVNGSGNRYASATDYESKLNKLVSQANRIAQPIIASTTKSNTSNISEGFGSQFFINNNKLSGPFTQINLTSPIGVFIYSQICDKFIGSRGANPLGITGKMMANAAKLAFDTYKVFVPAELALSQLAAEGGIGPSASNPKSKPIRTKNPFNVGNVDSGAVKVNTSAQSGVNIYYNLIARDYLSKDKTAKDLLNNFVNKNGNRYASNRKYESVLKTIATQANSLAQPIVASAAKPGASSSSSSTIA
jgi:hypothetical protein